MSRRSSPTLFFQALCVCLLTGLVTSCLTDSDSTRNAPLLVASRIKAVVPGSTDTSVTLLRYDSLGFLIREIRSTTYREWDSQGRYFGVRRKDSAIYLERVEWVTADSAVRTQGSLVIQDRFFKRRPNCWCADSIRHNIGDSLFITRTFTYDAKNNLLGTILIWKDEGRIQGIQSYLNTYDAAGKLISSLIEDGESGVIKTTLRLIEYDTLKNVTENR